MLTGSFPHRARIWHVISIQEIISMHDLMLSLSPVVLVTAVEAAFGFLDLVGARPHALDRRFIHLGADRRRGGDTGSSVVVLF